MNGMLAKGTPVVSLDTGVTLGKIESVYLDCESLRLVAFTFSRGAGLFARRGGHIVDIDDIRAIGPDAVTMDAARAAHDLVLMDGRRQRLVELDQLVRRTILTDGGSKLGHIIGIDFDPQTYRLARLRVDDRGRDSEREIEGDDVLSIGEEIVVVADQVTKTSVNKVTTASRPTPMDRGWDQEQLRRAG